MNMKKILDWLKGHWLLVTLGLAVLFGVPPMVYFSQKMSTTLQTEEDKKVTDASKDLRGATITYKVESLVPGGQATELSAAPNQTIIDKFKQMRVSQAAASRAVIEEAITFNRGPRSGATPEEAAKNTFLVAGLFPDPGQQRQIKLREMARTYTNDAHKPLLAKAKAGMPPDGLALGQELALRQQEAIRQLLAPGQEANALTAEQLDGIAKQLIGFRIKKYTEQAMSFAFYAEPSIFRLPVMDEAKSEPRLAEAWDWQTQFWIHQDIVRAVQAANAGSSSLIDAVVKRVERIDVDSMPLPASDTVSPEVVAGIVAVDPNVVPPPNYLASVTGRTSGPLAGNGLYDLRTVYVTAVVSTRRLPALLDAISRTNFMTVLDLDAESVDTIEDLKLGFFYGNESVIRVQLKIETAWLREWIKPFMPAALRAAYGIAPDQPPADSTAAGAPPNTPPAGGSPPPGLDPPAGPR